MGHLYFGDNLEILRDHIRDESVDLIYLDPPFNSKRDYNLLFKTPKGHTSGASITAFEDSWHWGEQAEEEFDQILHQSNTNVAEMMQALRKFLGENDMMAYLVMMCNRLLELQRVIKQTGGLYLHCDPTASHYLKSNRQPEPILPAPPDIAKLTSSTMRRLYDVNTQSRMVCQNHSLAAERNASRRMVPGEFRKLSPLPILAQAIGST